MDSSNRNRRSLAPKVIYSPTIMILPLFYATGPNSFSGLREKVRGVCRLMTYYKEHIIVYIPPLPKGDS
jgi:hypothetical protein